VGVRGARALGELGLECAHPLGQGGVGCGEDAYGEQAGVACASDRDGSDGDSYAHLGDRQQRVQAIELAQGDGDADDRQGGGGGEHARQARAAACAGDHDRKPRWSALSA
jgi:hypothetical protein